MDRNIAPLGLPSESDWILYGAYNFDRTLIRNPFIYELSNEIGRYATRSRFVEVFINSNGGPLSQADYMGVYSFMEKIKRDGDRVDVDALSDTDAAEPKGVNTVALRRAAFPEEIIAALAETHRLLYRDKTGLDHARETLRRQGQLVPQVNHLLSFVQLQHEGRHGRARERLRNAA